jgi:hypothetical protein
MISLLILALVNGFGKKRQLTPAAGCDILELLFTS